MARPLLGLVLAIASVAPSHALTVLSVGKHAVMRQGSGGRPDSAFFRFGRDRALRTLVDPTCAGGNASSVEVSSYPQSTVRVEVQEKVTLPCAGWHKAGAGFVYRDPSGAVSGVRRIAYSRTGLVVDVRGGGYHHAVGPVGYAEVWLGLGSTRLLGRFHDFRRNTATLLVTRTPSTAASDGEAAFWDALTGDDSSEAREQFGLRRLEVAAKRDRRDGRSRFLLAMLHLYRFGQSVTVYNQTDAGARAEITAAVAAFDEALPLLWDPATLRGDSRVPGFAAAARYALGVATGDPAVAAQAITELDAAVAVNSFFNVFDPIGVAQVVPPSDPAFTKVFASFDGYLTDPETLACLTTQPEICGNTGLAPRNAVGALVLFGDLYAKAGNAARATTWYQLARALSAGGDTPYRFLDRIDARLADVPGRTALYADGDPSNDPPLIGAREEACAVCHTR